MPAALPQFCHALLRRIIVMYHPSLPLSINTIHMHTLSMVCLLAARRIVLSATGLLGSSSPKARFISLLGLLKLVRTLSGSKHPLHTCTPFRSHYKPWHLALPYRCPSLSTPPSLAPPLPPCPLAPPLSHLPGSYVPYRPPLPSPRVCVGTATGGDSSHTRCHVCIFPCALGCVWFLVYRSPGAGAGHLILA